MNKRLSFEDFLEQHETFQAAIIEAVHRYFYDHCFNPYTDKLANDKEAELFFDIHQTMHNLMPDWRLRLKKNTERYLAWEKTNALNIGGRPKRDLIIKLKQQ